MFLGQAEGLLGNKGRRPVENIQKEFIVVFTVLNTEKGVYFYRKRAVDCCFYVYRSEHRKGSLFL